MFPTVTAKLATMRKAKSWVVECDQHQHYIVQASGAIGKFDGIGRGVLNIKGGYFMHLMPSLGAKAYTFPPEFVQECQEIFIRPGEKIGDLGASPVIYAGLTSIGDGAKSTTLLKNYLVMKNSFLTFDKDPLPERVWNRSTKAYEPYTDQDLSVGIYKLRSDEDFAAFLQEEIERATN